ncbi:MAG: choice-of-anchor D domain-containing protein [Verrucomicrobiales bacterium]|nr:choice-of-anchor D domain-containing protein [Verrucomicrobiales bacterium]
MKTSILSSSLLSRILCPAAPFILGGAAMSLFLMQATAGLVGFYPFDGEDPTADASGAGVTLQSAAADPTYNPSGGFEGGAFHFDGKQRWIAPLDINPGTLPQVTMGAWVRTESLIPGLRKIMGSDNGGWDRTLGLDDREGPFRYTSFIGNGPPATGTPGPKSTNQWSFVAASYDNDNAVATIYVDQDAATLEALDGVVVPTGFGPGLITLSIGNLRTDTADEGWQGDIDNVFVFDEALSPEQIAAIRDGGRTAILGLPANDPDLQVALSPDLEGLSKVPSVKAISFPIRNAGATKPLKLSQITIQGADAGYFSVASFPTELAPGASGEIVFRLDSQSQVGAFAATATVVSDDPTTPRLQLELASRVVASQTLLGLYSFDDAAAPLKDDSGGGRTLLNGLDGGLADPTYLSAGGISGGAFEFNGQQRLVAPININPSAVPRLGMGAWVKTATLEPGLRKVIGHDDGAWDRVIGLDTRSQPTGGELPDGTLRYAAFTGGNNFGPTQGDPAPAPVSTEAWTFLAIDYDQAAGLLSLYVDLDASTTDDEPQVIQQATQMGQGLATTSIGSLNPVGSGEGWIGSIDTVFFLSGALDLATMNAIRVGGKQTLLQFGPDPVLAVETSPVFGQLPNGASKTVQVQLRNGGASQPLRIVKAELQGRDAGSYTLGTIPDTLPPGGSASISVTFNPAGAEGVFQGVLELTSNDSAGRKTRIDLSAAVPFTSLRSSLLGFYSFDDAENPLKDDSGNGKDLTSVGADPTYEADTGIEGGNFLFGGSQRLVSPININPSERPVLTMGAWVKTASLSPGLRKIIGSDDGGWDRTIGLDDREGPFRYSAFVGNAGPLAGTPSPESSDDWTFIAATFNQNAAEVTLYVDLNVATLEDALIAATRPGSAYGSGFPTVSIGSLRPDNANESWNGSIDNVFFYGNVLSEGELTEIRNAGKSKILSDPPRILSIQKTGAGLVINWGSRPGTTYTVEYSASLAGPWTTIETQVAAGPSSSFTDTSAQRQGGPAGFYRIAVP